MPSVSINSARNSDIYQLIKEGVLTPNSKAKTALKNGKEVIVSYVKNDGAAKAAEESRMLGIRIAPTPQEYITKSFTDNRGNLITTKHDVEPNGLRLAEIVTDGPRGTTYQIHHKNGRIGGHVSSKNDRVPAQFGYDGLLAHPNQIVSCNPVQYKNINTAFPKAVQYIRGVGSREAYLNEIVK